MKKNCKAKVFCRLSVMRGALCGLLLLSLTTLFTHSPVYGQQNVKRISLKLEATSLLEALREINRLGDNVVVFKKEEVAPEMSKPLPFFSISSGVPMMIRFAIPSFRIFSAASYVLLSIDSGRTMVFLSAFALSLILSINAMVIKPLS